VCLLFVCLCVCVCVESVVSVFGEVLLVYRVCFEFVARVCGCVYGVFVFFLRHCMFVVCVVVVRLNTPNIQTHEHRNTYSTNTTN